MESHYVVLLAITSIGFISLCNLTLSFLLFLWAQFLRPTKNLRQYGSWAVITGSTDGIGKALALQIASTGLNLVLVGRNPSKLKSLFHEIREKFGEKIEIRTVVIDFAECRTEDIFKILEEAVRDIDVGILINNAGLAYPYARFFHEVDLELMEGLIRVNIEGTTWVTKAVLAGMLKRKKGAIVNVGSGSSGVTSSYPLYSVYAATKAYIAMFSRSTALEYKEQGIDVQCQIPLLVATKMASIKRSSLFIPAPETYSKASVQWIGYDKICVPYWPHFLQCFVMQMLPESLLDYCLYRYFLGMRKRGMKKDARIATGE